jgi:hypothetical protein
MAMQA